jgi:hypothetical protein
MMAERMRRAEPGEAQCEALHHKKDRKCPFCDCVALHSRYILAATS